MMILRLIFLLWLLLPLAALATQDGRPFIQNLPREDLENLKVLFEYLFKTNEFSYTLFGDKPVSFCYFPAPIKSQSISQALRQLAEPQPPLWRGAIAWERRQAHLPATNYILVCNETSPWAFIIHIAAFKEAVESNREFIPSHATADELLDLWRKNPEECIHSCDHQLLGILLGYGTHNARLFQKYYGLKLMKSTVPLFQPDSDERVFLDCFQDMPEWLSRVGVVNFAADRSAPETSDLQRKYAQLSDKILKILDSPDWFEQILDKLSLL